MRVKVGKTTYLAHDAGGMAELVRGISDMTLLGLSRDHFYRLLEFMPTPPDVTPKSWPATLEGRWLHRHDQKEYDRRHVELLERMRARPSLRHRRDYVTYAMKTFYVAPLPNPTPSNYSMSAVVPDGD